MVRRTQFWFAALLLLSVGCSTAKVVREGKGWREVEANNTTVIQMMTDDPDVLADLARTAPDARVRTEAMLRVKDSAVLAEVVRKEQDPAVRRTIVLRLTDPALLKDLAKSDPDAGVRDSAAARAEMLRAVDARHPEYAGWAACRPGSWVRFRVDLKIDASKSSFDIVRTLLECGPDRAIIEQKVVATGRGPEGLVGDMLGRFDVAFGRKVEDEGSYQLQGRAVKGPWVRYNFQRGGDVVQIRRWMRDEVPGGVARIDLEVSPEGRPLSSMMALATAWGR
ncbi:MAG: HEAT repeat domain-containing protein [Planctomycetes bacterium]|nr:HEAT repeat domain-containing protein [Planctomycetota bacterium]